MKWQKVQLAESKVVAKDFYSMVYNINQFDGFKAGQYCNLRITQEDGQIIQRSYSVASAPSQTTDKIEFGIQIIPNGKATSFFEKMKVGDEIEMLGPLGGSFKWEKELEQPLLLIGGGSGIVPLVSILRENIILGLKRKITLIFSFKSLYLLPWQDELFDLMEEENINGVIQLTQEWPDNWEISQTGRITQRNITTEINKTFEKAKPLTYICGSNSFVESLEGYLEESGFEKEDLKTERYG